MKNIRFQDQSETSAVETPIVHEQFLELFAPASAGATDAARAPAVSSAFASCGPYAVRLCKEVTSAAFATAVPAERLTTLSDERRRSASLYVWATTLRRSPVELGSLAAVTAPAPRVRSEAFVAIEQLREFLANPDSEFTRALYEFSKAKRHREAVGKAFSEISRWARLERTDLIDSTLRVIEVERLSSTILVGLLSATFPVAAKLTARANFFDRTKAHLRKTHSVEKAERLIRSLA